MDQSTGAIVNIPNLLAFVAFILVIFTIVFILNLIKTQRHKEILIKLASFKNGNLGIDYIERRLTSILNQLVAWKEDFDYDLIKPYMTEELYDKYFMTFGTTNSSKDLGRISSMFSKNDIGKVKIRLESVDEKNKVLCGRVKILKNTVVPVVDAVVFGDKRGFENSIDSSFYFELVFKDDWKLNYFHKNK